MTERSASRLAWSLCVIAVAAILADQFLFFLTPQRTLGPELRQTGADIADELANLGLPLIGALIASRRRENPLGWIFLAAGCGLAIANLGYSYAVYALVIRDGSLPGGFVSNWLSSWTWTIAIGSLPLLLLLFPTGRLHSRRWRPVLWITIGSAVVLLASALLASVQLWDRPFATEDEAMDAAGLNFTALVGAVLTLTALSVVGVASVFVRFLDARGEERLQLRWFAFAATGFVGILVLEQFIDNAFTAAGFAIAATALWASIGIAILKYRLYDIDLVIRKAVVYGVLAGFIALVYFGVVVAVPAVLAGTADVSGPVAVAAAAIVALAIQPLRRQAQRLANRLVYGKRATPFEVLSVFADRLAGEYSVDDVVPRMARVLAEGTGAQRVIVWLRVGEALRPSAAWPDGSDLPDPAPEIADLPDRAFEVTHQGESLGAITVAMASSEPMTLASEQLVENLAAQAGLVLRNVRLAEELRATIEELRSSRQRIVAAQDEERRRIERNIHDGAQQQLVALAVKLGLVERLVERDPGKAASMLAEAKAETGVALDDLRDLARGIYPPLLVDKGLAAALEAQARRSAIPVTVEPDGVGRYPQDAEAAVYFCCLEARQNVGKYAGASSVAIRLGHVAGELTFEVADDGAGFNVRTRSYGTGLQGMADRLAALDGSLEVRSAPGAGTTVAGRVPAGEVPA
jgi:signal transduction histidine kinase